MPGRVDPVREGRLVFVDRGEAAVGLQQEPVGADRSAGTGAQAGAAALAAVQLQRLVPRRVRRRWRVRGAGGQHEVAAERRHVGDVVASVPGQPGAGRERLERRFEARRRVAGRLEGGAERRGQAVRHRVVAGVVRRYDHLARLPVHGERGPRERPRRGADDDRADFADPVRPGERDLVGEVLGRGAGQLAGGEDAGHPAAQVVEALRGDDARRPPGRRQVVQHAGPVGCRHGASSGSVAGPECAVRPGSPQPGACRHPPPGTHSTHAAANVAAAAKEDGCVPAATWSCCSCSAGA